MTKRHVAILAILGLTALACSAGDKLDSNDTLPVATVTLTPAVDTIHVGEGTAFTAVARDNQGTTISGHPVTWASSNEAVATVAAGQVTAIASGAAGITATIDGVQGSAIVVVLPVAPPPPGTVATVSVVPPSSTVTIGNTVQLVATPQDSNGGVITGVVPAWASANGRTSVNASGLVTGVSVGVDTVRATVGAVSGFSVITVQAVPVGSVEVSPGSGTLDAAGATLQLTATVKNASGGVLPGSPVTWTSSNTAVARVDSTGFVTTSLVPGSVTISAASGGKVGTAQYSVILRFRSISTANGSGRHTCGVTALRAAYCWGKNSNGAMGIGTSTTWNAPIAVIGSHPFTAVATGADHSCGVTVNGEGYCWGADGAGQLGDGANSTQLVPVKVTGGVTFDTLSITAGGNHTCALTPAGTAYCWGSNTSGELGSGAGANQPQPTAVSGGLSFAQISAGPAHTCAVTTGGAAYCWGDGTNGKLGTGNASSSPTPVAVGGGLSFSSVSAGGAHTCGITTGGLLYCWGDNSQGQFGNGNFGSSSTPVPVFGGQSWAQVDAGVDGTCGVVAATVTGGRSAQCWGSNLFQQIGNGDSVTVTKYVVPAAVQGPSALQVSRGEAHSCLVSTGGVAYCWGRNSSGELGVGSFTTNDPFSIALPGKVVGQP